MGGMLSLPLQVLKLTPRKSGGRDASRPLLEDLTPALLFSSCRRLSANVPVWLHVSDSPPDGDEAAAASPPSLTLSEPVGASFHLTPFLKLLRATSAIPHLRLSPSPLSLLSYFVFSCPSPSVPSAPVVSAVIISKRRMCLTMSARASTEPLVSAIE